MVLKQRFLELLRLVTSDSRALLNSNPAFAGVHFEHQPQSSPLTAFLFLGSHARIPRWCSKQHHMRHCRRQEKNNRHLTAVAIRFCYRGVVWGGFFLGVVVVL